MRPRWRRQSCSAARCLLGALVLGACASPLLAAEAQTVARHDLTVIVYAPSAGPAQVALSYPKVVDHTALAKAVEELGRRAGAAIGEVQIADAKQAKGFAEMATAAQFTARGLIPPRGGVLPVGPIIRSLPGWQRMRLVFVVGEEFTFGGPRAAVADGFAIRLANAMKPYEYDVERKNERIAAPEQNPPGRPVSGALLPAVIVGLPAGMAVGWLLATARATGRAPGSLQTKRGD